MGPAIRRATPDDAAAIARVHTSAWQWAYRGHMPDDFLDGISPERPEEHWRTVTSEDDAVVLVAELGAEVVGFISVGVVRDEPHGEPALTGGGPVNVAELHAIYLLEQYVGLGIGRALMAAGEDAMRGLGADRAVLWVLESNTKTHRFYEVGGWLADGETSTYAIAEEALPVVRFSKEL